MSSRNTSITAAIGCGFAALLAGHAGRADKASRPALGGAHRYLTAVSTDKPIYRPGETVWARGVMLDAFAHKPLAEAAAATIEIKGPKGETVAGGSASAEDSVWAFGWQIPDGVAGGEYTLRATYPYGGHAPAERKFDVRVFRAPRLKSQIVFARDGYGPGDKVTATLEVTRAEGGIPAGAKVTAIARVDGAEVARVPASVNGQGRCSVSFSLPKPIARGEGSLAFAIEDGGVVETAAKTLPILLQTLDLDLHPEGGELSAGVPTRVYFQARTPADKPADIAGVVLDEQNQVVARFRSEHEGRGRFELTARAGGRYRLRVEQPAGIKTTWVLPAPVEAVSLRAAREVTPAGSAVALVLASSRAQKVRVTLSQREVDLASVVIDLPAGQPQPIALAAKDAGGVLTATVWSADGKPLAERLVYRRPVNALKIDLRADRARYAPGDTVVLTARATRQGQPVSALVGLTVSDDTVREMLERREQPPSLPAMVLLEPEVRELADAEVYLDDRNPKAPLALDLLLGTQGWRRFALTEVSRLVSTYGDDARRALALRVASPPQLRRMRRMVDDALGGLGADKRERDAEVAMEGAAGPRAVAVAARPAPVAPPAPQGVKVALPKVAQMDLPAPVASMNAAPEPPPLDRAHKAKKPRPFEEKEIAGGMALRQVRSERQDLVYVREYAHPRRPDRRADDRVDFTETLYFHAGVRTDAHTGEAKVRFSLSDSVTAFRVLAGGFDETGALGAGTTLVTSVRPFYLEPKLPLEVTSGDLVRLPLALVNGTDEVLRGAGVVAHAAGGLQVSTPARRELAAGERARLLMDINVGRAGAPAVLTLDASAGQYGDKVVRELAIKPNGFPFELSHGGFTVKDGVVSHAIAIPAGVVPGSVTTSIAVYPTPLANMTQALSRLIQDPSGCFEQTSSTSYPLTMAQQYFLGHTGVDAKLIEQARDKLDAGYKRLVGFETPEKGYEWFGQSPGHEALTAYGLLHFADMAKVREVDGGMMARTRAWLLAQRDGKGGFERKRPALHTWIEDRDSSNGYILWALLETGAKDVGREVDAFAAAANSSQNSYVHALGANVLALAGRKEEARKLMDRLVARQGRTGAVEGATASIVGSGGEALEIEATALATLAWLREPSYTGAAQKAIKYLAASSQDGRYGSTQSTVLALRAIVAYDAQSARPKAPGRLIVLVDGEAVGNPVSFDSRTQGALKLPDVAAVLDRGEHRLELRMEGGAPMPYSISVSYSALTPASSKESKVSLAVALAKRELREGEVVEATATVGNRTAAPIPTPVAIVGLPGGLEPRHDQLKELVKKGAIDAYEVRGREVVLYWRGLRASQTVSVPLSLVAAVPGRYTAPASRAYLYYTDEHKTWTPALVATIAPR